MTPVTAPVPPPGSDAAKKRAVMLAIRAIAAECRRLAVDANIAERLGATYPGAREAAKLRGQYRQAVTVLETMLPAADMHMRQRDGAGGAADADSS